MRSIEASGKTYDVAVENGLKEIKLTLEQVEVETISEGGFLRQWKVKLTKKLTDGEKATNFVETLLEKMELTFAVDTKETDEEVYINLIGTDSSAIIGYRGEVLDSIQYLTSLVLNTKGNFKRVVVDAEGYRAKREQTLIQLANNLASKVVRTQRMVKIEPMNPYERRVIHSALEGNPDVTTFSEGIAPNRYVIIALKGVDVKSQKFADNRDNFRGNSNFNRRDDKKNFKSRDDRYSKPRDDRYSKPVSPAKVVDEDAKVVTADQVENFDAHREPTAVVSPYKAIDFIDNEAPANADNDKKINTTIGTKEKKYAYRSTNKRR